MIIREHYINQVRPFYESDLIKIITGIRRCGKSVILSQIMDEIREKHDNVIFLNFEDKLTTATIRNSSDLIRYVKENRKPEKLYLFLDEVQELVGWQDACKTLRLYNTSVFITGSNSKLLSGEFTKELSGRFVSFRVRPLSILNFWNTPRSLEKKFLSATISSGEDFLAGSKCPMKQLSADILPILTTPLS